MSVNRRTNRWSGVAALGAGLLLAACGGGSPTSTIPPSTTPTPADSAVVALEAANFDATIATGVTLVEFYHPTCSHCRAMAPVVEQLATDFRGQAVVGKVNVTTDQALTQAWGVRGYPTFVIIKGGSEQSRLLGETSYARLAGMIRAALAAS